MTTFTKEQMLGLEPIGHGAEALSANDGGEVGLDEFAWVPIIETVALCGVHARHQGRAGEYAR